MESLNVQKVKLGLERLEKYLSKDEIIKLDLDDRLYVIRTLLSNFMTKTN